MKTLNVVIFIISIKCNKYQCAFFRNVKLQMLVMIIMLCLLIPFSDHVCILKLHSQQHQTVVQIQLDILIFSDPDQCGCAVQNGLASHVM